jgi:hypothetical protein
MRKLAMTELESTALPQTQPAGQLSTAINIFTAPGEAFTEIDQRPTKLFPLALIAISTMAVMFWYFSILDFDWFIDGTISRSSRELTDDQAEAARETFGSMSQGNFKLLGVFGSLVGILAIYVLQASYLSMVSALSGDRYKFSNWFSLVLWCSLPTLLSVIGRGVTILLSPNGQLSAYDLDPLTLANLGMISNNESIQTVLSTLNLPMFWTLALLLMAYRQCLNSSVVKALSVVLTPYLLIFGVWAYFALG